MDIETETIRTCRDLVEMQGEGDEDNTDKSGRASYTVRRSYTWRRDERSRPDAKKGRRETEMR
jgi:hypothetical protein